METNRTLILPQLRLGKPLDWAPFPILAKYYKSQDKDLLKASCNQKKSDWRTEYQPCRDLNEWIDLPWSTFFDLKALKTQFKIRIIERVGHDWGVNDISHLEPEHVVVLDPTSFPSNGSDWETMDQLKQQEPKSSLFHRFFSKNDGLSDEERNSLKLTSALKNVIKSEQLMQMDQTYIQFGSLVYGLRFLTSINKQQNALQKALRSNVFVSPNQFHAVNQVSQSIIKTLGGVGSYSSIHMTIEQLVKTELKNQRTINQENAEIEGTKFIDKTKFVNDNGIPLAANELLNQLKPETQSELMTALVRELNGDMPINQAISAALPLEDSLLRDLLSKSLPKNRQSLLSACIEYRKAVDARYPIYYLSNDVYEDINAHLELFGPMMDAFPCTFTKNDIYEWAIVDSNWAKQIYSLTDPNIDYEKLLSPVLEILVASKGMYFPF